MHTIENSVGEGVSQQIMAASREILSLGADMDDRGLHWKLGKNIAPEQRLAFALAVYFSGGLYVLIDSDRGFLCVERIAQKFARLQKARKHESYRIGHAFAELHDALGYGYEETIGFSLIHDCDLHSTEGFIKGFGDSTRQSLEGDVMIAIRGKNAVNQETFINSLRHFIDDHMTVAAVARSIC